MPKGMFTQGLCVLLESTVSLEEIETALSKYEICNQTEANDEWAVSGPALIVAYRQECNGLVSIDVVEQTWPDHMGDPKNETMIFGAWSMGHFGPFAFPGGLQRASQQCWGWEPGKTIAERHSAFIRIRSSYAYGAKDEDSMMPNDYEPRAELEFVSQLATELLNLPNALCYFNPNGEVLRDQRSFSEALSYGLANELPPLDAWSNVRMFIINAQWSLMDTVGNWQLDIPDVEACFHSESFEFNEVDNFLRNVSLYMLNNGDVIKDGDTMDGPGDVAWQANYFDNGLCDPPRPVLRWLPMDDRPVPPEVKNAGIEE